jgi:site-specific DNA-adenine methylase
MYKNIQMNHETLYNEIQTLITEFHECGDDGEPNGKKKKTKHTDHTKEEAIRTKENYYYWIRPEYNALTQTEKNTPHGSDDDETDPYYPIYHPTGNSLVK